ncbi:MAG: 30S ribosomal protein S6e [Candidatus Bathyarchaeia archaeon]|nr:30S ribosomal protein S6e [Candidatus Bathyarchaeota archaeon]
MPKFKIVVSDPEEGKTQTIELEGPAAKPLVGRELGEIIDGGILGLPKMKVKITGGTDKDGIPMRMDVHGGGKKKIILSGGIGFKPKKRGERRRRLVRGRVITEDTYLINMVLIREEEAAAEAEAVS